MNRCQTTEDVRRLMGDNDIKGFLSLCKFCPIAQYLMKITKGEDVDVFQNITWIGQGKHYHTPTVKEFIANFDSGYSPELIQEEHDDGV